MTPGLTTTTTTSALGRETPTKETPERPEMYVQIRLKRLLVRIGETLKRLEVYQCWSVVADMGQWWSAVDAGVQQGRQCGLFGRI